LDRLVAARGIRRDELAGLFRKIDEDGAGLEQAERLPARTIRIDDRRERKLLGEERKRCSRI
jgi:hypothetical protein